jgi:hypothetical protein
VGAQGRAFARPFVLAGPVSDDVRLHVSALLWRAYAGAVDRSPTSCHLPLSLLAAIGQVESGSLSGRHLDAAHRVVPAVFGPELDGHGFAAIADTDHGELDADTRWDRAVGPMQMTPGTWAVWGQDGDDDGVADPQDIEDATTSAAAYLCSGGRDLGDPADLTAAILDYNHSPAYLRLVLGWKANLDTQLPPDGSPPLDGALPAMLATPEGVPVPPPLVPLAPLARHHAGGAAPAEAWQPAPGIGGSEQVWHPVVPPAPGAVPVPTPSPSPSPSPGPVPTTAPPSVPPTVPASGLPSASPTVPPSVAPTVPPSVAPSPLPSESSAPSAEPTGECTQTASPTAQPSFFETQPTEPAPTSEPESGCVPSTEATQPTGF